MEDQINDAAKEYATTKITGGAIPWDYVSRSKKEAFKAGAEFVLAELSKQKIECKHENITMSDGLAECLDCGTRNF